MLEIDNEEHIIRIVRKHWFVLLGDLFILIFCVALPVILLFVLHVLPIDVMFGFSGSTFFASGFLLFAWLLIVWMMGWNMWTDYYLDVLVMTDRRIFDIEQKGLFSRLSSSFRIDRIQNITVDQKGIIQTMLNFGTMRLETAGEKEDFVTHYITMPHEIKKFINELQDKEMERSQLVHIDQASLEKALKSQSIIGDNTDTRG